MIMVFLFCRIILITFFIVILINAYEMSHDLIYYEENTT
jgi:hypothetical protein